ncbi:MAG: hypothetical protein AVDCRST_MAG93-2868 [uncultured Chloroflexia bacterium]|uniref:Uncharacterized protein n=1 Tax=uncultured Chloroflexia bacterium TaxID=1672391 RepID=A0A6J4JBM1_9CHLR|nr:MAG: hypothetical protein AVDCRST_MAG93-2868 [uncultured Chloroflexia bacterium]
MSYRDTARRLQALEARADAEAVVLIDNLLRSLSDDELEALTAASDDTLSALTDAELERLLAEHKPTYADYKELCALVEERRASST